MIINASKRCDIPAYFSEWMINRLKTRKVATKNPYSNVITEYDLNHDNDFIIFWSKNPIPMIDKLTEIQDMGYQSYWQYTLNNYTFEKNLPSIQERLNAFLQMSEIIGKDKIIWRYDPIIFANGLDADFHLKEFEKIAKTLNGHTNKVVISFVDAYTKISGFLQSIQQYTPDVAQLNDFAKNIADIAKSFNLEIASCAEKIDLDSIGIKHNACVDSELISKIIGKPVFAQTANQRGECRCAKAIDIGKYDTCDNGCGYCYANGFAWNIHKNMRKYNPDSLLLCE